MIRRLFGRLFAVVAAFFVVEVVALVALAVMTAVERAWP